MLLHYALLYTLTRMHKNAVQCFYASVPKCCWLHNRKKIRPKKFLLCQFPKALCFGGAA